MTYFLSIMDYFSLSDKAIESELGARIKSLRLRRNITQQELADATALSLGTVKSLEAGRGKLASLIAVLRELGALQALDSFVPPISISPLQLAKTQGRPRQRASRARHLKVAEDKTDW